MHFTLHLYQLKPIKCLNIEDSQKRKVQISLKKNMMSHNVLYVHSIIGFRCLFLECKGCEHILNAYASKSTSLLQRITKKKFVARRRRRHNSDFIYAEHKIMHINYLQHILTADEICRQIFLDCFLLYFLSNVYLV